MHRMWKTIEKSDEHKVVVDAKKHFFSMKKLNKHPISIAWDRMQLKVILANINVSM